MWVSKWNPITCRLDLVNLSLAAVRALRPLGAALAISCVSQSVPPVEAAQHQPPPVPIVDRGGHGLAFPPAWGYIPVPQQGDNDYGTRFRDHRGDYAGPVSPGVDTSGGDTLGGSPGSALAGLRAAPCDLIDTVPAPVDAPGPLAWFLFACGFLCIKHLVWRY